MWFVLVGGLNEGGLIMPLRLEEKVKMHEGFFVRAAWSSGAPQIEQKL